jgi:hypothetical protein
LTTAKSQLQTSTEERKIHECGRCGQTQGKMKRKYTKEVILRNIWHRNIKI